MNSHLILSIFHNQADSDTATNELQANGIEAKDISILIKGEKIPDAIKDNTKAGATTGGIIGGIAGLLVGIGAITLPGIGAVLVGGPIVAALGLAGAAATAATTISGGLAGAVTGGLIGSLVGLGLSEEEAKIYETSIKEGAILLGVAIPEYRTETVKKILITNKGREIKTVKIQEPGVQTTTFSQSEELVRR